IRCQILHSHSRKYSVGLYRHYEDVNNMVQVLEILLWDAKACLVLLLPFHVEKLAPLEKLLTPELISERLIKASVSSLAVSLPKANISSSLSQQKALPALGLTDAWDPEAADFSGVSDKGNGRVHLAGTLHWASLELATQAGKGEADLDEENVEKAKLFYADHPFIIMGEVVHDEL
uniref:Serpin domain-containing protein n=1 Tax=Gouania willdenowi TaxID=441366 RepID=A0A8C5HJS1_GOUWI